MPVSALRGWNVVNPHPGWCGYQGHSLLQVLELLPHTPADTQLPLAFPVQWVEKSASSSADTRQGRARVLGPRGCGLGGAGRAGQPVPSGQKAVMAQVLDHARPRPADAGSSAGIVLDREVDVAWRLDPRCAQRGSTGRR